MELRTTTNVDPVHGRPRLSKQAELRYPRPPIVIAVALLLAVLSGLGAGRWLHSSTLPVRAKAAWIVACVVVGLPALFSLMALQPRPARQAQAQAATATRPVLA